MTNYTAVSGYWSDIQDAVDLCSTGDTVIIPNGTHNFAEVGDDALWTAGDHGLVEVPAGVNIRAETSPTMDGSNRFPVTCNVILQLPYDAASGPITVQTKTWFYFAGTGAVGESSRFSGIMLKGYRSIDNTSVQMFRGVRMIQVLDFRIDHCLFENINLGCQGDGGVSMKGCGVIDHNKFYNTIGYIDPGLYDHLTIGYGIHALMFNSVTWDNDITNILGKYLNYSIYIENNYFSKWRHCISAASGGHIVFRYNMIEHDYGNGSIDIHGQAMSNIGGRCLEIYENTILDGECDGGWDWHSVWYDDCGVGASNHRAIEFRGGGGVIYNNVTDDATYQYLAALSNENPAYPTHDLWIWDNTGEDTLGVSGPVENVDYYLRAPTVVDDGFVFTPYTYPHPLITDDEFEESAHMVWIFKP
jgi:hypothetical protein